MNDLPIRRLVLALVCSVLALPAPRGARAAQSAPARDQPDVRVTRTSAAELPGEVDSNSPMVWQLEEGVNALHVFTSRGYPHLSTGRSVRRLSSAEAVAYIGDVPGGIWLEAVINDEAGVFYGYYHNERELAECPESGKTAPRIGAVKSLDGGRTWQDLGIVLDASADSYVCETTNTFFVGGVGDFSAVLDHQGMYLYFFVSTYAGDPALQGVGVARMLWADRDDPVGSVAVWQSGCWEYPGLDEHRRLAFPVAVPIINVTRSWHDPAGQVDALWGPSVHWNRYLDRYVMLLNHASDADWNPDGIYVAFSLTRDSLVSWTEPLKILDRGAWYPQVLGSREGDSDKLAGQNARLFMGGRSVYSLRFLKPGEVP